MIRTLVVDDDFRVADLHRLYTERVGGFEVVGTAHTGGAALDLIASLAVDLVLLDIYLPDMSGLDVLRTIRQGDRPVDVIAITAAQDVATIRAAMQGGSMHYLIKPFAYPVFREKLQSYAEVHARLGQVAQVSQGDVDRLYGLLRAGLDEDLPKGLSVATRDVVVGTLRAASSALSAAEVARASGLSRVTARRYLEYLAGSGSVEITLQYGTPGRPEHRYRIRELGPTELISPRRDRRS